MLLSRDTQAMKIEGRISECRISPAIPCQQRRDFQPIRFGRPVAVPSMRTAMERSNGPSASAGRASRDDLPPFENRGMALQRAEFSSRSERHAVSGR